MKEFMEKFRFFYVIGCGILMVIVIIVTAISHSKRDARIEKRNAEAESYRESINAVIDEFFEESPFEIPTGE